MGLFGNRRIGERAARSDTLRWAGVGRESEREDLKKERGDKGRGGFSYGRQFRTVQVASAGKLNMLCRRRARVIGLTIRRGQLRTTPRRIRVRVLPVYFLPVLNPSRVQPGLPGCFLDTQWQ